MYMLLTISDYVMYTCTVNPHMRTCTTFTNFQIVAAIDLKLDPYSNLTDGNFSDSSDPELPSREALSVKLLVTTV